MSPLPRTIRAYSSTQADMRDLAWIGLAIWVAGVSATLAFWIRSHWVSGSSVTQLILTETLLWAFPIYWSIRTLLTNKDSVVLDLERQVIRSGLRLQRETPLHRACPLDVVTSGGSSWDEARLRHTYTTQTYHVVARGWHNYVVYRSFFARRADSLRRDLQAACGCEGSGESGPAAAP